MEKYKNGDNIVVYWNDAVIYGKKNFDYSKELKPAKTITEGKLVEKNKEFVIIESPKTFKYDPIQQKNVPKLLSSGEKITFYFIPVGMIEKMEKKPL